MAVRNTTLLSAATAPGVGNGFSFRSGGQRTFQAVGKTSSGVGAASVEIQGSNTGAHWVVMGTISLTLGVTETSDGFASDAAWQFIRASVASISGTGAEVSVYAGS